MATGTVPRAATAALHPTAISSPSLRLRHPRFTERDCMSRIFNFSAGPAMLPAEVLARAGDEMLDWRGTGMSVMEMSHRGPEFISIAAEAEADLRSLAA